MPRVEFELGDRQLEQQNHRAYYDRQQGNIQLWTDKLAGLKTIKLDLERPEEAARIRNDMAVCEREVKRIQAEVELAQSGTIHPQTQKPYTPGDARQHFKRPVKPPRR